MLPGRLQQLTRQDHGFSAVLGGSQSRADLRAHADLHSAAAVPRHGRDLRVLNQRAEAGRYNARREDRLSAPPGLTASPLPLSLLLFQDFMEEENVPFLCLWTLTANAYGY